MTTQRPAPSRRQALIHQLGADPGRYAVAAATLGVLWFPFRLYLTGGDLPPAAIVASSALYGTVWALFLPLAEWYIRRRHPHRDPVPDRAHLRRGAFVGLAVGVPFYGALLLLCLFTGRYWLYPAAFAVALPAIVTIAARRLRR